MSWELQSNLDSKKEIRAVYGNTLESLIKEGRISWSVIPIW